MPNAYTLYGEIKADTSSFKTALRGAEMSLLGVKAQIDSVEGRASSLGRNTAVAAHGFDQMRISVAAAQQKLALTAAAFERGEASASQMRAAMLGVERATGAMNSKLGASNARLTDFAARSEGIAGKLRSVGQGMVSFGQSLSLAVTAPLAGLGGAAIKSASSIDALRNKLTAATGSTEAANAKLAELRNLAQNNAGVFASAAADTFAYFKAMKVGEPVINEMIKAFGRLSLANEGFDSKEFARNMSQLFDQNFELQDLKQAIGVFPQFGQIAQKAFGLTGSGLDDVQKGLQEMVKSGKLTREEFFRLFAAAVNGDAVFSKLTDTVGIRFQKAMERLMITLEPLGNVLISAIEPAIAAIIPVIERFAAGFAAMPAPMQMAIVAAGALAAALGPLLIVLGSFAGAVASIITFVGAAGGLAALAPIIGGIAAALGVATLAAGALYVAWTTNFGGIQQITASVATGISTAWTAMLTNINTLTAALTAQVAAFWVKNGADIMAAVTVVSQFLQSIWAQIAAFWTANQDSIQKVTTAAWAIIGTVVMTALKQILELVKLAAAIINGDWGKAMEAMVAITQNSVNAIVAIITNLGPLLQGALRLAINSVIAFFQVFYQAGYDLGQKIGEGMVSGITAFINPVAAAAQHLANAAVVAARGPQGVDAHSPSKKFFDIGQDSAQGFINGISTTLDGLAANFAPSGGLALAGAPGGGAGAAVSIHIIDDSNGRAKVEQRPTGASTTAYYNRG